MSLLEVKVPQLSESVADAILLQWKKKIGDAVAVDEILIDVETDKVTMEVPSPAAGVLVDIVVANGGTVVGDQVIARIDTQAAPALISSDVHTKVAMPAAAKLMADHHIDANAMTGTGKGGRITKGDVLSVLSTPKTIATNADPARVTATLLPQKNQPSSSERPEQRVPMSRLRARVAERLLQSQSTNAILTTFNEVNMAPMLEMRKRMQEAFEKEHGIKLGLMSFFVKAAVHALKKYPVLNASVDGTDIVYHGYFDIGVAVGSPRGLVVPILRNADQMSFADIEKKIAELGALANSGKLEMADLTGGTFTISNGGTFGSMMSTPIINPPQSAILGIHATKDRAVVENGQIVVRPMNYFAMSYDHRIIDGREAVLGLVAIKQALEDPARLLFDI